jgi:osmoprotectant transport system permease protein
MRQRSGLMIDPIAGAVQFHDRSGANCIRDNKIFCPDWLLHNGDRYVSPTIEHVELVLISVVAGFAIAFAIALLAHRRRWLATPVLGITGALYTIPSIAMISLLIPITGLGNETGIIALTIYNLQIVYRNVLAGLNNVPAEAKDAARGMGLTDNQMLLRVELPLAVPEIFAGLRIATVSTVALAALVVFCGGGGLGTEILSGNRITFKTGIVTAGSILILMAFLFDGLIVLAQRLLTPWRRVEAV